MSDSDKNPILANIKHEIALLEGVPIPFNLHIRLSDLERELEKCGY